MDRKSLGINGIHQRLGLDITEAEFRGYMIAKIESHHAILLELKKNIEDHEASNRETISILTSRISSLESSRTQATGFIAGISVLASLVTAIAVAFLIKILGI